MADADARPKRSASRVTQTEWNALRDALPEHAAALPEGLVRASAADPLGSMVAALSRDGGVIVERAVSEATADAVIAELHPYIDATATGHTAFTGGLTKRTGAVVARSPSAWPLLVHSTLMDVCEAVLGQQLLYRDAIPTPQALEATLERGTATHPWQLQLTQSIQLEPGAEAQSMHQDQTFIYQFSDVELEVSVMWALDDFTAENGATQIAVGTHRTAVNERPDLASAPKAVATMPKGSCFIYTGSVWHGGGCNSSDTARRGLNVDYNLAFLRQVENQYLSCPPHIAAHLPVDLANLIGYQQPSFGLGFFGGILAPKRSFAYTEDEPINWANPWHRESKL